MGEDKRTDYIRLREPADVIAYVQRLVNRLRREDLELDSAYIGKIIYLLNTWIAAYKTQQEAIELKNLKEELSQIKQRLEGIGK